MLSLELSVRNAISHSSPRIPERSGFGPFPLQGVNSKSFHGTDPRALGGGGLLGGELWTRNQRSKVPKSVERFFHRNTTQLHCPSTRTSPPGRSVRWGGAKVRKLQFPVIPRGGRRRNGSNGGPILGPRMHLWVLSACGCVPLMWISNSIPIPPPWLATVDLLLPVLCPKVAVCAARNPAYVPGRPRAHRGAAARPRS